MQKTSMCYRLYIGFVKIFFEQAALFNKTGFVALSFVLRMSVRCLLAYLYTEIQPINSEFRLPSKFQRFIIASLIFFHYLRTCYPH